MIQTAIQKSVYEEQWPVIDELGKLCCIDEAKLVSLDGIQSSLLGRLLDVSGFHL